MKQIKKQIGKKLFSLALAWSRSIPATKKEKLEQVAAIKGRKKIINSSKSQKSAMEAVEDAANKIKALRYATRIKYRGMKHGIPANHKIPSCFNGNSLKQRLINVKNKNFRGALDYRFDQSPTIDFTKIPANVGVWQHGNLNWDYYAKSCKYPKKETETTITIPVDWGIRVRHAGIAQIDGMTTIDAQRVDTPNGVTAWAAKWIVQGRGYTISVVSGYIASIDGIYYHAETLDKAIRGVAKKANAILINKKMVGLFSDSGIANIVKQYPDLCVCIADAKAIHACDYGITSWCNAVGIDEQIGCVTLQQMYAAYKIRPATEARAAILHAIKRQTKKQNLLTLAA